LLGAGLGFVGNLVLARRSDAKAVKERAYGLLAQVVTGLSSFQIEVDSFAERRVSNRAKLMALGQVIAGVMAGAQEGHAMTSFVEELRFVRTWDLAEGDRLVSRLGAANAVLLPPLMLLRVMDPKIDERAGKLAEETATYASAKDDAGRKAAGARMTAALNELGASVRQFADRKWWRSRKHG
jgi:hypothetical protein